MAKEKLETIMAPKSDENKVDENGSPQVQRRPLRRTPVGGPRNVLRVEGSKKGYQYRVVNDVGDRIESLKERGYEVVTDEPNIRVGDARVGANHSPGSPIIVNVGGGIKGVVMRQRQEWYDEDRKAKDEEVDRTEQERWREARDAADYGNIKVSVNKQ